MKKSKQLFKALMACFLLVAGAEARAACSAHFTWTQTSPNTISFTNTSTGAVTGTQYSWNFGDGQSDWISSPQHVYNIPGHYAVCLTMMDSGNVGTGCNSTFCDSIIVTGTVICNMGIFTQVTNASCNTCTDGAASFLSAYGASGTLTYSWSGGVSGSTSSVSGLPVGTYTLTVTDANGCHASTTAVVMSNDSNCHAHFTKFQSAMNTIQFTNNSVNTSSRTTYYWDFGNGTTGFGATTSYVYNVPGIYTVCLSINDSMNFPGGCSSSFCDTVKVTGTVICNLTATTSTNYPTCSSCQDGSITASPAGGTAPYTFFFPGHSALISNTGPVSFGGYGVGADTVCVQDANGCRVCQDLTLNVANCHSSFTLTPDPLSVGDYIATNNSSGTGYITNSWSWGDGGMDSLYTPTHVYNAPGMYTICLTISDGTGCSSTSCDTLTAARLPYWLASHHTKINVVNHMLYTGITESKLVDDWKVYPNPASSSTTINYTLKKDAFVEIVLLDLTGRTVLVAERLLTQNAGTHQSVIDVSGLSTGTYLVRINANDQLETRKITLIR